MIAPISAIVIPQTKFPKAINSELVRLLVVSPLLTFIINTSNADLVWNENIIQQINLHKDGIRTL